MNLDHLIDSLRELPDPIIEQVQDYVDFLKSKHATDDETAENRFWSLIDLIDWDAETEEGMLEEMERSLSVLDVAKIYEFQDQLAIQLRSLDGAKYYNIFGSGSFGASADTFLYGRCFVVANGRKFYDWVHNDARNFPVGDTLELLLYSVEKAYKTKTGETLERRSGTNFETGHNLGEWGEKSISYA